MIENCSFEFDTPTEDIEFEEINWQKETPKNIKNNLLKLNYEIEIYCNKFEYSEPEINVEFFQVKINTKNKINYLLEWVSQ